MATIGTFTKKNDGFTGTIQTLGFKAKVTITPVESENDKAPDYRVYVGDLEIGAGWTKTSKKKRTYVGLKIDDQAFANPVYANLVTRDDGQYDLLWSR